MTTEATAITSVLWRTDVINYLKYGTVPANAIKYDSNKVIDGEQYIVVSWMYAVIYLSQRGDTGNKHERIREL